MTGPPAVRVLCGYCGRKLGTVTDSPAGLACRSAERTGGPAVMFCPEHGWPDLASEAFRRKLARAPATHTAKMLPAPPPGA